MAGIGLSRPPAQQRSTCFNAESLMFNPQHCKRRVLRWSISVKVSEEPLPFTVDDAKIALWSGAL